MNDDKREAVGDGDASATNDSIVGTWQLVEAWDIGDNVPGQKTYPWGNPASGYWCYDSSGNMGLHISMNPPLSNLGGNWVPTATNEQIQESFNGAYMAYFGTYTYDAQNITHNVFSDVLRAYTGTQQVRPYTMVNGEIHIGDGTYLRRLVRLS